jgi:hypothetical protein
MLVILSGVCFADETQAYTTYIQGGKSTITNESSSMMEITVDDIISHSSVSFGNQSFLRPVSSLSTITVPLNAALVFSSPEEDAVTLVQIHNLSFSEKNTLLTLQVQPLEYYEGSVLNRVTSGYEKADLKSIKPLSTGIYLEEGYKTPENMLLGECCYNEALKHPGMTCYIKTASEGSRVPFCYCSGNGEWWNYFC